MSAVRGCSPLAVYTRFGIGLDRPRDLVCAAIDAGLEAIGFSDRAATERGPIESVAYQSEIRTLQEEFSDRIRILCGIECDPLDRVPTGDFDYIIGAVRSLEVGNERIDLDPSTTDLADLAARHFGGDLHRLIRAYWQSVASLETVTQCDLVGEIDLLAQCMVAGKPFDTTDPIYLSSALAALDVLLAKHVIFGIAAPIGKGNMRVPSPSTSLLRYIAMRGGSITPLSEVRRCEALGASISNAVLLAHACGFGSILTMTTCGWKSRPI